MRWTTSRVAGVMAIAAIVGYVVGPTAAQAAANLVKVSAGTGPKQLSISSGRALVDTEASSFPACLGTGTQCLATISLAFTAPNGGNVIAHGTTGSTACSTAAVVDGIVVDRSTAGGATTVTVTGDTDNNGTGGDLLWQGTAQGGGHLDDTFDGAVFAGGPIAVTTTDSSATWILYGVCLSSGSRAAVQRALSHMHR
jgi:hypothetical protein